MKSKHEPWSCCLGRNPEGDRGLGTGTCAGLWAPSRAAPGCAEPRARCLLAKASPVCPVPPAQCLQPSATSPCHSCPAVSLCWGGTAPLLSLGLSQLPDGLSSSGSSSRSPCPQQGAHGPRVQSQLGSQPAPLTGAGMVPSSSLCSPARLTPRAGRAEPSPSKAGSSSGAGAGQQVKCWSLMNMEQRGADN